MEIKLNEIKVRDVVKGYIDNQESGVVGFDGKLDIRPPFQREFIYNEKERNAVIDTINKGFPLNVMYWSKNGDNYELLDGQQRTLSICQYVNGDFSVDYKGFNNLPKDLQDKILDYKLMIYICEGTPSEKLDWFKIINIAGEKLTDQELRNSQYTGKWLHDAKRHFSKTGCPAYQIGEKYLNGSTIRQDYLETALKWIASKENESIEEYMGKHQHDDDANALWQYYQSVIDWINRLFPNYRREMKGIDWGLLYNEYKDQSYNSDKLEQEIVRLMQDDDVTSKKGIYVYLITGQEKYLSIRAFTDNQKREAYERQKGICQICKEHFEIKDMEADHITPWHAGGKTTSDNCQMLCRECNRRKSGI
ncbi:MAG: DUF262 domain-containing protein [Firmicutes bacterium]|jgi:hypothetical protein|nr:DUF262 domain-containing protein [Bacillota bacterium]